jgi:RNA polymerase sigma-70 factor (ECF subfamily)
MKKLLGGSSRERDRGTSIDSGADEKGANKTSRRRSGTKFRLSLNLFPAERDPRVGCELRAATRRRPIGQRQMSDQPSAQDTDLELVARIATGDRRAFETLFRHYGERVFRYAHRLINDVTKAEEVTNDVMLEVWKSAPRFEARSQVSTWILGITRHLALNAVRRKQLDTVEMDDAPPVADDQAPTAGMAHDQAVLERGIRAALADLSADHRDVIELTFFHGLTYPEIAVLVGCPENTVKTRMFHARKQLQRLLRGRGLDPANVEMAS